MTTSLPRYFISTYARVIVTNWPTLNRILFFRTSTIKDQLKQDNATDTPQPPKLLTNERFNDALNGPFSRYLKSFLSAFSVIAHINQQTVQHNDGAFKLPAETTLNNYQLDKNVVKKISNNECEKIAEEISKLMIEADDTWSDYINEQCSILMEALRGLHIELTDTDQQDFLNIYTISELIDRLTDMNIETDINESTQPFDFKEYFKLKCKLAIYSHTSRQHQTPNAKSIHKTIEALEPQLNTISSQEKETVSRYQNKIDDIIKPIAFAKLESS